MGGAVATEDGVAAAQATVVATDDSDSGDNSDSSSVSDSGDSSDS